MTLLFKTRHGSHLYGLAHAGSDEDFYRVVNTRRNRRAKYATQTIVDGVDTTTVDLGTWVNMCQAGVPQALEAMFAPDNVVLFDALPDFRRAFRFGSACRDRYFRTIDNFLDEPNAKKNRHGLRLALNLRDGLRYGRFNPTLSPANRVWVTYHARHTPLDELRELAFGLANA
jgi:hypothetical protein